MKFIIIFLVAGIVEVVVGMVVGDTRMNFSTHEDTDTNHSCKGEEIRNEQQLFIIDHFRH